MSDTAKKAAPAHLNWIEGGLLPVATQFGDTYYSKDNGLKESEYTYLEGNDLEFRFKNAREFTVAELGFGTALNFLLTWQLWQYHAHSKGKLTYISFEKYPLKKADLIKALGSWAKIEGLVPRLIQSYTDDLTEGWHTLTWSDVTLHLAIGDIHDRLPEMSQQVDAWFLDGFAPAKNPDMWTKSLLQQIGQYTRPQGTFATFTAASEVRHNLTEAGFHVERLDGFGHKRHMMRGRKV